MDRASVVAALRDGVRTHFDPRVADALLRDAGLLDAAADKLVGVADGSDHVHALMGLLCAATDAATRDWLANVSRAPGRWFVSRCDALSWGQVFPRQRGVGAGDGRTSGVGA